MTPTTFQDWLKTAYEHRQITVTQGVSDNWIAVCSSGVLDEAFRWLANQAAADTDKLAKYDFLVGELMEDGSNQELINALFDAVNERRDITEAKRSFALRKIQLHIHYLMNLSGASDYAASLAYRDQQDLHASADAQGAMMSGTQDFRSQIRAIHEAHAGLTFGPEFQREFGKPRDAA